VREAYAAGLRFDVGHGLNNVSFDTAARVLDQGVQPHTISTDIHRMARNRLVYDLPTTMAKCLALGFSLTDVVQKATYETARSLNRPELVPGLAVGAPAIISVFRVEEAAWQAEDSMGRKLTAQRRIVPQLAIRGEETFEPLAANRP
jgi:dihydroorotase